MYRLRKNVCKGLQTLCSFGYPVNRFLLEEEDKRIGEGREKGKGREGKKKGRSLYGSQLSTCSAPQCGVKILTNQLLCLHSSWHAKFCLSLFKMASCVNETMAVKILVVELTSCFSGVFFYYRELDRMMVRMLSRYLNIT